MHKLHRYWAGICLALILLTSSWLKLNHLGHRAITYWDESFHALTARNLLKHPLKFTLIDQPWLPYDYKSWSSNHIWLHKPPLSMWGIALSYALLGVNAFALRFPSVLLSGGAVIFTYLIGRELFDKRIGLIAAFWQAFNACSFRLIHGYLFSDHVDIALLFWVEASCYLLVRALLSGSSRTHISCGVAQGLAYLSKSYLGLLAFGISLAMWLLARLRRFPEQKHPVTFRHLLIQFAAILVTIAPWSIYALIKYPKEFIHENWYVLAHLNADIESWGATWDRPLFDYMVQIVPVIYTAVLASTVLLIYRVIRYRTWQEAFIVLWSIGVIVPHSVATTKTPSATLIVMPALVLALSVVIGRGLSNIRYASFWAAMGLVLPTFPGGRSNVAGRDDFDAIEAIAPYLMANLWIVWRVIGILGFGMMIWFGMRLLTRRYRPRLCHSAIVLLAIALTVVPAVRSVQEAKRVTDINADDPTYLHLGQAIQRDFAENACFFLDGEPIGIHQRLMFWADRTVYMVGNRDLKANAATVKANGGVPYLISRDESEWPLVADYTVETGYRIYALTESQHSRPPSQK